MQTSIPNAFDLTPGPEHFIRLGTAAKMASSKSNVLRKHRVAGWREQGLAHKDPVTGEWWVDPSVVLTIKPVRSRSPQTVQKSVEVPDAEPQV